MRRFSLPELRKTRHLLLIILSTVVEYVGPRYRTMVVNLSFGVFFTGAACALPWVALATADWRLYALVTTAPLILAIFTPCVVPESARLKTSYFSLLSYQLSTEQCLLLPRQMKQFQDVRSFPVN